MTANEDVRAEEGRERRWAGVLFALTVFLLVPRIDPLRIVAPIEQTLLLLCPAIAVSALVAWRGGGSSWLAAAWLAIAGWMLWQPLPGTGAYDALARGWSILLAAMFGVTCLMALRKPFLTRALAAIALAFALAAAVVLVSSVSPSRVERAVSNELSRRVTSSTERIAADAQSPQWQRLSADHPSLAQTLDDYQQQLRDLPNAALPIFPALLGVESLAALALAWSLFHRISRARIGPPLAPLRSFRLGDEFVWGLLAGIAILVIPNFGQIRGLGLNLSLFFGALYALRGLGVLSWVIAPRALAVAIFIVFALIFWPRVVQASFVLVVGLGLLDNWLDWRRPARQAT